MTKNDDNMNMATMRSDFHSAITRLVESTSPTQQAFNCHPEGEKP